MEKIIAAGVIEKEENFYAVWQMRDKKFITINFSSDNTLAHAFLAALREANDKISLIGNK